MPIKWDHPAAIELRKQIVASLLEEPNLYIRSIDPRKGKNMNDIIATEQAEGSALFDIDKFEEILDDNGNPTGQYRPREAAPEGATFITAEDGDHEVTVTVH